MNFNLTFITVNEIYLFLIIITRFIGFFITTPGLSEPYIPQKLKVILSVALSIIVWANTKDDWILQITNSNILLLIIESFLTGYLAGSIIRIAFSGLHVAGSIISYHMGLTNAFTNDPVFSSQSSIPANFIMTTAIFLMFITNSHHILIGGFIKSFEVFPMFSSSSLDVIYQDMPKLAILTLKNAFDFALTVAAPIIIIGLLVQASMGVINRLIPQIQVFFIMQPLQIILGILTFMIIIPIILNRFIEKIQDLIITLLY